MDAVDRKIELNMQQKKRSMYDIYLYQALAQARSHNLSILFRS